MKGSPLYTILPERYLMDTELELKSEQPAEPPVSDVPPESSDYAANDKNADPTLRFRFNDDDYEWPCRGYEERPLRDALAIVRQSVGLRNEVALKVRMRPGDLLIDQEMEIASVLSQLGEDRQLIISIRNLNELSDKLSESSKPAKKANNGSLKKVTPVAPTAKVFKKHVLIQKESPVYSVADDRVELPLDLLHMLEERSGDNLPAILVPLFLGAFLGSVLSLLGTLLDNSVDTAANKRDWVWGHSL